MNFRYMLKVKRKTKYENRFHRKMGALSVKVITIKLYLFNIIPIKTLYKYRETYHGEVKDVEDCKLSKV